MQESTGERKTNKKQNIIGITTKTIKPIDLATKAIEITDKLLPR